MQPVASLALPQEECIIVIIDNVLDALRIVACGCNILLLARYAAKPA